MPQVTFYSKSGAPIAYTEDDRHIFLFNGSPVGYLHGGSVYSYGGSHLGRFSAGWVRDNSGSCVFFTDGASGGPIKPLKGVRPVKSVKQVKPVKAVKEVRPVKPVNQLSWSKLSGPQFFRS